jgi:hypothetical protein
MSHQAIFAHWSSPLVDSINAKLALLSKKEMTYLYVTLFLVVFYLFYQYGYPSVINEQATLQRAQNTLEIEQSNNAKILEQFKQLRADQPIKNEALTKAKESFKISSALLREISSDFSNDNARLTQKITDFASKHQITIEKLVDTTHTKTDGHFISTQSISLQTTGRFEDSLELLAFLYKQPIMIELESISMQKQDKSIATDLLFQIWSFKS